MEKIAKTIADIEGWLEQLKNLQIKGAKDLEDVRNFHAVSMLLFSIINGAINIGEEIISLRRLGFPSSYKEIFKILEKNKVMSKQLAKEMAELVVYRNMFAHQYWSFDEKDVWKAMQKINSASSFVKQIVKYLGKNRSNKAV